MIGGAPWWLVVFGVLPSIFMTIGGLLFLVAYRHGRKARKKYSERLMRLAAMGGFDNPHALVDDALNFYEHMTEQAMKGNLVGVLDKDKQFTQVLTDGMKWARDTGRITGAAEA